MAVEIKNHRYRPTESQFKGMADEMYVTYDLEQKTRGNGHALYPKVKRVYIAGDVRDWTVGEVKKRSGRVVYGVTIEYQQSRSAYHRRAYIARRGRTSYKVDPASVKASYQIFRKIVEVPRNAHNVHLYRDLKGLPEKYHQALQDVR